MAGVGTSVDCLSFSKDGQLLAAGGQNGSVKIWHPIVEHLAISGYQGVKIWNSQDWDDDPYILAVPSASRVIAWSPDGKYLAHSG